MNVKKRKREVYLDYAAATPVDSSVLKKMAPFWRDVFANASSTHVHGREARAAVTAARKTVAQILAVKEKEIIFTGGATEGNNIALQGSLEKIFSRKKGKHIPHILISSLEHPSTKEIFYHHEKNGEVLIEEFPTSRGGVIDIEAFKKKLRPETVLVSAILVDNKTGVIQPIREMGLILKEFKKKNKIEELYFHSDASQAPRYLTLRPHMLGVDLLTLDGAKVYGPKGVGVLFVKEGISVEPLFRGGGQERGIRSGTINTPLVVGFAEALSLCEKKRNTDNKHLSTLKKYFIEALLKNKTQLKIEGSLNSVSGVLSLTPLHTSAEELFTKLNARGVYTSLGSACESEDVSVSFSKKRGDALRISFGRETTKKDLQYTIQSICEVLDQHAIMQKE